jgi:hypothetical protein
MTIGIVDSHSLIADTQEPRKEQAEPRVLGNHWQGSSLVQRGTTRKTQMSNPKTTRKTQMSNPNQNNPNQNAGEQNQNPNQELAQQQQDGKEQLDAAVASTSTLSSSFQAIANAYSDYTKKSFEDTKSFVEKLASVRSPDKAIEIQIDYAKTVCETFVAESKKIGGLYSDLARQAYKPFEGFGANKTPPTN